MTLSASSPLLGDTEGLLPDLRRWLQGSSGQVKKVVVIGLDSAPPELVFRRFSDELPNLQALMSDGAFGVLESVVPAITVPAWAAAMTGRDPGELGIYGFRHRSNRGYGESRLVNSSDVREDAVWDVLSRRGDPVIVIGVPPGYPPRHVRGNFVSCFLSPNLRHPATFPQGLANTISDVSPAYAVDVEGYRTDQRSRLIGEARAMTEERFRLFRYLLRNKPWRLAMLVEIGLDRMHHALWSCFDPEHPRYVTKGPHESAVLDYYRLLDRELGATLAELDHETAVFVVSDHGAKRMHGGICLNEWLRREGYLTLRPGLSQPMPFRPELVDWRRTSAWAEGGYCGRVFLNLRGREPDGRVDPGEAPALLARIESGLSAIPDERGAPLDTRVFRPESIYRQCRNFPPDLMVYLGNLDWRASGSLGGGTLHLQQNDTGPDDANHDAFGILIGRVPGVQGGCLAPSRLMDLGPTLLHLLGS